MKFAFLMAVSFVFASSCPGVIRIPCVGLACDPQPTPTVEPSLPPSPVPTSEPVPSPVPSAEPSPVPTPAPTPVPTPVPCPSPKPQCMTKDGQPAVNCVSCAQFIASSVQSGDLIREGDKVYNIGNAGKEYFDPRTCFTVWPDGSLRNKRLINDGTVCGEGCSKEPPVPCASPSPKPSPSNSPSPLPSGAPPLTESGNYPINYLADACEAGILSPTHEVGISVLSIRDCSGEPNCRVVNLHATEKSVKPFCEHSCYDEQGRYSLANCRLTCETLRECQQPEFVVGNSGVKLEIKHPDWNNEWGACDKRTADCDVVDCRRNFICHDRVVNRAGKTKARACMPDGTRCGPEREY